MPNGIPNINHLGVPTMTTTMRIFFSFARRSIPLLLLLSIIITGLLNAAQPPKMNIETIIARKEELNGMIKKEIGTPSASQLSQCKSIAFGAKPCGGPWSYLVYSTANTNEPRLMELVSEFNQLDEKINQELGIISLCDHKTKPTVGLAGGVCTAKTVGSFKGDLASFPHSLAG
jgi:hypothetical protein